MERYLYESNQNELLHLVSTELRSNENQFHNFEQAYLEMSNEAWWIDQNRHDSEKSEKNSERLLGAIEGFSQPACF
jgi:hypothetical protein